MDPAVWMRLALSEKKGEKKDDFVKAYSLVHLSNHSLLVLIHSLCPGIVIFGERGIL